MTETVDSRRGRRRTALLGLLIYQCVIALVVVAFGYRFATMGSGSKLQPARWLGAAVCACWAIAMVFAAVGMVRQKPGAHVASMAGHLVVGIAGLAGVLGFAVMSLLSALSDDNEVKGFAPMFLIFAALWLPCAGIAGAMFFYIRRLGPRQL